MTAPFSSVLDELQTAVVGGRVLRDLDMIEAYRRDRTTAVAAGTPCAVVEARSVDHVVTTLQWASRHRVPVVARGAGTSLAGGATATDGCVVLTLNRMDRILELAPDERLAVVEAGVITADLDRAARASGLMYGPDPSSYEICTIGGNLATNAGGLRCLKYGVTRDSVLGLSVVLADGRVVKTGRRTMKGVVGYDLTGLFVGSEGTLGIITSATMRLRPAPPVSPVTLAATFSSLPAAADAVLSISRTGEVPSLLELMDRTTLQAIEDWKHIGTGSQTAAMLIAQCDGPDLVEAASRIAGACRTAGANYVAVSSNEAEAAQLIGIRRLAYPATERLGDCLVEDVCVPLPALRSMIERIDVASSAHGVRIATVAHAGDGNLHPVFVFPRGLAEPPPQVWGAADEVFRAALDLGGTLSGEHGVGSLKRRWLAQELSPNSLGLHQAIKSALDPLGILNPGRAI